MSASASPLPQFLAEDALDKSELEICTTRAPQDSATKNAETSSIINYLPGEPRVSLNRPEVDNFLMQELSTPLIDNLYPWLLLVAIKAGDNVSSLHRHKVKGYEIVPAEDPKLHLVWDSDRIYIKPLPICLLNYQVWTSFLAGSNPAEPTEADAKSVQNRKNALGFLRSYAHLIRHPIDLKIAHETGLIPQDVEIKWTAWVNFISGFQYLKDDTVAARYHFGHLRLNRLNWTLRILQPEKYHPIWYYLRPHWSVAKYVEGMFNYLLFSFATGSLVLSAMQVALTVPQDRLGFRISDDYISGLYQAFWVFSSIVLYGAASLCALFLVIPVCRICFQLWGALFMGEKRRSNYSKVLMYKST